MASALSRALKLPGKKGSELGEYDPLTQADSEDESEEDDLVLSYPRNGIGRDGCLGPNSRSGRFVGSVDEILDEEDEDDDWREHVPSLDGDDLKDMSYRDQRRVSGSGLVAHSTDTDAKKMKVRSIVRTTAFLVPLVCATLLVLLCAFLIPCQKGKLHPQWERALGGEGITPPALALWDANDDSVKDVLVGVTESGNKVYSAEALSGVNGQILWNKSMQERVMFIQCGLQIGPQKSPVCLLISKSFIMAVNGTTGETVWSNKLDSIESQVVLLPDLQGDLIPDLLIATLPADTAMDLSLTIVSGKTGKTLGRSVPFNISGQGKLIGPLLHKTQHEAYYILFGLGNIKAISLCDLYNATMGKMPLNQELRKKDPVWEGLKARTNSSTLIHIFGGAEVVTFLYPHVVGYDSDHNNLDILNQSSTRSDWVLLYGNSKVSVLRQKNLRKNWTFNSPSIQSQPSSGHFNDDGVLDIFLQHSANGTMKVQIINGANNHLLWSSEFACPHLHLGSTTLSTSTGHSAFLFWASEPQKNLSKTTTPSGVAAVEPLIRKLFLLHPAYPTILLELNSTTDTAVTSAVTFDELQEDATYITVSSPLTNNSSRSDRVVKIMSLKAAINNAKIVRLSENNMTQENPVKPLPSAFEVNTFFRRLSFKH